MRELNYSWTLSKMILSTLTVADNGLLYDDELMMNGSVVILLFV